MSELDPSNIICVDAPLEEGIKELLAKSKKKFEKKAKSTKAATKKRDLSKEREDLYLWLINEHWDTGVAFKQHGDISYDCPLCEKKGWIDRRLGVLRIYWKKGNLIYFCNQSKEDKKSHNKKTITVIKELMDLSKK
ncbi:hypothetical protein OAT67_03860 [Bacteriovoracaceae bacterium]|nr:hypothetical protein [Bacteriovoracaceae bacterium]